MALTTHILDTSAGTPAAGVKINLYLVGEGEPKLISQHITNADGRTDSPLLPKGELATGTYRLEFHIGDYFKNNKFLDIVPVQFTITDSNAHYHVPLLVSPFGYSTYRGS